MKRFRVAAALVLILGLGTSSKVHAQLVYGYTVPTYGGVQSAGTVYTPFGTQTFSNFYSPFTGFVGENAGTVATPFGAKTYANYYSPYTGMIGQSYSTNVFGAANSRVYGYNPYTGYRYGTGFFQPNYLSPYGRNYNWVRP
jgi:hypothetical protein